MKKDRGKNKLARVFYADLWGTREQKYEYLFESDVKTTKWQELKIGEFEREFKKTRWSKKYKSGFYFFTFKSAQDLLNYGNFWGIDEIFKDWSFGVTTSRDHFVVGFSKEEIIQKLKIFTGSLSDDLVCQCLELKDTRTWKLSEARQKVKGQRLEDKIYPYAYRPFDTQWICYEPSLIERDRQNIMHHILREKNFGLNLTRRLRDPEWKHVYVTESVTDKTLLSFRDNCYFFPLYLYPDEPKDALHKASRTHNFKEEFLKAIKESIGKEVSPEEIFYYIYAVLYSPTYRTRYEEFLKIDFPRIPLPTNYELFKKLSELGKELVELHLLKSKDLDETDVGFPASGSNEITKVSYDEKNKRVLINKAQYFDGISKDVWEYQIGAYQVMEKYLKDRKGRKLSLDEVNHYMKVAKAIRLTIELQERIDEIYNQ